MYKIDPEQFESKSEKDILQHLIAKHSVHRFNMLQDYYEGNQDILNRTMVDPVKPNNKIVVNLCKYAIDVATGYFIGKPVAYDSKEEDGGGPGRGIIARVRDVLAKNKDEKKNYIETLLDIFHMNNEQDHNAELAKEQGVKGETYELLYNDEDGFIRFSKLSPENTIYVESNEVDPRPLMGVRIYSVEEIGKDEEVDYYDVYTDSEKITFKARNGNESAALTEVERARHYFGEVPIIQYLNNNEKIGDFEPGIPQQDAYNKAVSDTANDFEYFTDAYLKLVGARLDDEQKAMMRENRIIVLPDKECDADFLIKTINDVAVENHKNRLREDFHAIVKVPNLTDDSFGGNITGVAISFKLWGTDQLIAVKDRKFKKGLQRRIKLITNVLNAHGNNWDWRTIDITFSRNMPQNLAELAQVIANFRGLVSDDTLRAQIPFVEDPQLEGEKMEEQKENEPTIDLDTVPEVDDEPLGED